MSDYENQLIQEDTEPTELEQLIEQLEILNEWQQYSYEQHSKITKTIKKIHFHISCISTLIFIYILWQIIKLLIAGGVLNSIF